MWSDQIFGWVRIDLEQSHQGAGMTGYLFKLVSNSFLYLMNPAAILVFIRRIYFIMFTQFFSVSECLCFCVTVCRRVKDRLQKRQPDH